MLRRMYEKQERSVKAKEVKTFAFSNSYTFKKIKIKKVLCNILKIKKKSCVTKLCLRLRKKYN